MISIKNCFYILTSIFLLSACSPSGDIVRFRLNSTDPKDLNDQQLEQLNLALVTEKSGAHAKSVDLKTKSIKRWQQTINGIPVANSYVHLIQKNGTIESATGQLFQTMDQKTQSRLDKITRLVPELIEHAKRRNSEINNAKKLYPPEIELVEDMMGLTPVLVLKYVKQDESDVMAMHLSDSGYVLSHNSIGYHLVNGVATVFTNSPARSDLAEVVLRQLLGDGTLTSSRLKVRSALSAVKSPTNEFKFATTEPSFNEVQTYFFMNRTLDWFGTEYGINLPFQLDVKTHVGGHTPSNVAFYYDGNIRLGDGDNSVYKDIPRDPTIVAHEVAHAYIDVLSGLPSQGEGGSMNEGFADFFAANMLNTPRMGEFSYLKRDFKRTLDNNLLAFKDFNGGKYHDSTIVSGTLWEIRNALGPNATGHLAIDTLTNLGPGGQFVDFAPSMLKAVEAGHSAAEVLAVRRVLQKRGWIQ
ncbi:MAG: hypothetical protein H6626_02250 [Pseudobdellovibrionaceae bacterium]|nr:hypothetical protein [Bdellovibrionales bacterium]USN47934.1 MAG: hypothetical protein H6626_02250 [Pseudobdellovibrionaceae bacterium]